MKKSTLIHGVSIVAGVLGFLALIGAWAVGEGGAVIGLSQVELYINAIVLQIIAVSGGVCALYRRQIEKEGN